MLALLLLSGCSHQTLVGIDIYQHDIDGIRVPVVAHVRSLYDVNVIVPQLIEHANKHLSSYGFTIDTIIYVIEPNKPLVRKKEVKKLLRISNKAPAIHLFLAMEVLDYEGKPAHGLYVRDKFDSCKAIIVLSDTMLESTFTHELGHFFGLEHEKKWDNIMKSGKLRLGTATFTDEQIEIFLASARDYINRCWS